MQMGNTPQKRDFLEGGVSNYLNKLNVQTKNVKQPHAKRFGILEMLN